MGLYLCIFASDDHDDELDGVEVGSYGYFGDFRDIVSERLEEGVWGSRFPTLMNHEDGDGVWTASECHVLVAELAAIRAEMEELVPRAMPEGVQSVLSEFAREPANLADCFVDVDGALLLDRLFGLASAALDADLDIWFQ